MVKRRRRLTFKERRKEKKKEKKIEKSRGWGKVKENRLCLLGGLGNGS